MNNTQESHQVTEKQVHLYDYLEVLHRRKSVVIIFFTVLVAAVIISTYSMTPVYESTAKILIAEQEAWEVPTILTEFTGMRVPKIQSEIEVIKSRTLAEKVVRKLNYDVNVFAFSNGLDPQLSNISVPDDAINKTFTVKFQDGERFTVADENDVIGRGILASPFAGSTGVSFTIQKANAKKGSSFKIRKGEFPDSVNRFIRSTGVATVKNTNVIKISTRNKNKQIAADMANSIIEFYRRHDIKARSQQASQVINFIENQIGPAQGKVNKSMSALAEYKSRSDVTDIKEGTKALIMNSAELEQEKARMVVKQFQVRSLYNEIQRNASSVSPSSLSFLGDPVIRDTITRISILESSKESLYADYTDKHPQVVALSAEINELKRKANATILNILKSLDAGITNLSSEINGFKKQLKTLPGKEKVLAELMRNAETNSILYNFLLEKLNKATVIYASTLSQMQVIDKAIPSASPVKPKKTLNIILAIITGLAGGIGLAFFMDYLDNSIKSPHDVEKRLGLPIFGRIPYVPANKPEFLRTRDLIHSNPAGLITLESAKSITAESFRSLRTNLQFAVVEKKSKIIHFTSPEASEGKTTIAANLAITLALMGSKTLIIDMDLRKPKIHHIFGIDKEPGIIHLLARKAALQEVVKNPGIEYLSVIPVGIIPPNPSELLNQQNLGDVLNGLRKDYDYIVIDSPPVLPVTDAQLLGRLADATFLVMELGATKLPAAEYALNQLRNVDINVAGGIINKVKPSNGYNYYYYSYYYAEEPEKKMSSSRLKFWEKT